MSNFVTFERVVFEYLGGIFMDTNFDKKIFIKNVYCSCLYSKNDLYFVNRHTQR